jgi:hypothetical protein
VQVFWYSARSSRRPAAIVVLAEVSVSIPSSHHSLVHVRALLASCPHRAAVAGDSRRLETPRLPPQPGAPQSLGEGLGRRRFMYEELGEGSGPKVRARRTVQRRPPVSTAQQVASLDTSAGRPRCRYSGTQLEVLADRLQSSGSQRCPCPPRVPITVLSMSERPHLAAVAGDSATSRNPEVAAAAGSSTKSRRGSRPQEVHVRRARRRFGTEDSVKKNCAAPASNVNGLSTSTQICLLHESACNI